jgi:hypothetical protein
VAEQSPRNRVFERFVHSRLLCWIQIFRCTLSETMAWKSCHVPFSMDAELGIQY